MTLTGAKRAVKPVDRTICVMKMSNVHIVKRDETPIDHSRAQRDALLRVFPKWVLTERSLRARAAITIGKTTQHGCSPAWLFSEGR